MKGLWGDLPEKRFFRFVDVRFFHFYTLMDHIPG
jgi:hypothetical protein